eukprot:6206189-Pleurochrysis_carterae.AAC.1
MRPFSCGAAAPPTPAPCGVGVAQCCDTRRRGDTRAVHAMRAAIHAAYIASDAGHAGRVESPRNARAPRRDFDIGWFGHKFPHLVTGGGMGA